MKLVQMMVGSLLMMLALGAAANEASPRITPLDDSAWGRSRWISAKCGKIAGEYERQHQQAAAGTSWFVRELVNAGKVVKAKWMIASLGLFEAHVNGSHVGEDFLAPGFTHYAKTKYSFTYDVTKLVNCDAGATNIFSAQVSAGWWRDQVVGYAGKKSALRGVIELTYENGNVELCGTDEKSWRAGIGGPVVRAGIFDGEIYDARVEPMWKDLSKLGEPEINTEFAGRIFPTDGAEVVLRTDLQMKPKRAYCWQGAEGADVDGKLGEKRFGKVKIIREFCGDELEVRPGETLVVDFGQNCAAVPQFRFKARKGTELLALFGEMLNDDNGLVKRGNDGPEGSMHLRNIRQSKFRDGMRVRYTFDDTHGQFVSYHPQFSIFGYRYMSITATDAVTIDEVRSLPVSSITKGMEIGSLETGDESVNQFISNVRWSQLSNYLSVPTDCPQRNERLGWLADAQVFCEAGTYNADTRRFFGKWMRDIRDNRGKDDGFPVVAPYSQYGNKETFDFGWADAGVIVPWTIWKKFGDRSIIEGNYEAMSLFVRKLDETKYDFEGKIHTIFADWLSYEPYSTCRNEYGDWEKWKNHPDAMNYRRYLAACYWLYDARLMAQIAVSFGKGEDAKWFSDSAKRALQYIRDKFVEDDGLLLKPMRNLQTACVFALKFGIVEGEAKQTTLNLLVDGIRCHGGCMQTGFLGTSFIMDALTESGAVNVAYSLLLQHRAPSWLYSVDQGATTTWERWNSYDRSRGFGDPGMNSFNHYAAGSVLAWMYRVAAGIDLDLTSPNSKVVLMAPKPDRRLGKIKAEYKSAIGPIRSEWKYEGKVWKWNFSIPEGAYALVTLPGESDARRYESGSYCIDKELE